MNKFDPNEIRIEIHDLKSCTLALGGSARVVDHEKSSGRKEVYKRIPVPSVVARKFKGDHKRTKYIKPIVTAFIYYGDTVIALERHPLGALGERVSHGLRGDKKEWTPMSAINIREIVKPVAEDDSLEWYFDGRYMFAFDDVDMRNISNAGRSLTSDGRFRAVECTAISLHALADRNKLDPTTRTCLAYVSKDGRFAMSPPIWKDVSSVGKAKVYRSGYEDNQGNVVEKDLEFDRVDDFCAVNLSFALRAAADLSEHFGFEAIEPLNIPQLMIKLNTVNLPKVPQEVKATIDCGMRFTHALAWLLGYARRAETMEQYSVIRGLLQHLTSKGIYFRSAFSGENIFHDGHDVNTIPLLSKQEAIVNAHDMTVGQVMERIRERAASRANRRGNVIGGTLAAADDENPRDFS